MKRSPKLIKTGSRLNETRQKEINTFNKKSPVRVFTKEEIANLNKKSR